MAHAELNVIDISRFNVNVDPESVEDVLLAELANDVHRSFTTTGFLYLNNHGITNNQLKKFRDVTSQFFSLPVNVKQRYRRPEDSNGGYIAVEREGLNPARPTDLKEAYNILHSSHPAVIWPKDVIPEFESTAEDFYQKCSEVTKRILILMALGLKLKDKNMLWKAQLPQVETDPINHNLRVLHYPPVTSVKNNQLRCGEHSDYGCITLLFQDDVGGLQVFGKDGSWKPVEPIPDTICVNVGDMMQRWSSDTLISTRHRVIIPDGEAKKQLSRTSIAFFVDPPESTIIECLDGSNKYEPITSGDYLRMRFSETY